MTYTDAIQAIQAYKDGLFGTRLLAVHRTRCDDGTEDLLVLKKLFTGCIELWYMHSCGHQLWLSSTTIEDRLPKDGWQLVGSGQDTMMFSVLFPGKTPWFNTCPRHSARIVLTDYAAD